MRARIIAIPIFKKSINNIIPFSYFLIIILLVFLFIFLLIRLLRIMRRNKKRAVAISFSLWLSSSIDTSRFNIKTEAVIFTSSCLSFQSNLNHSLKFRRTGMYFSFLIYTLIFLLLLFCLLHV